MLLILRACSGARDDLPGVALPLTLWTMATQAYSDVKSHYQSGFMLRITTFRS